MISVSKRTLAAISLGSIVALVISILNGRTFAQALYAAVLLALIIGFIVGLLSWAIDYTVRKGYQGWLGFMLVLFLNIFGVIILVLLPSRNGR